MRTQRTYKSIEAVVQRIPVGSGWYAGFGYEATEGTNIISGGNYLETTHATFREAQDAAFAAAKTYRNVVLTLGGCTFETLPTIRFRRIQ